MNKVYETYSFSGKSINCYGLEIVKRKIISDGNKVSPFNEQSNNDVLFSLYWPEQIYDFIKWRYKSYMKGRKIIIGGNTATSNPSLISSFDCDVFIGDGELFSESHIYKNGKRKVCKAVSDIIIPINYEDIQDNRRSFLEMSRGCKNKCLFCQYTWLKPYRECNIEDLKQVIKRIKTKSVRMFAADRFQHSGYEYLRSMLKRNGKCDTGSDVSIKFLLKNPEYLKYTTKVRAGLEGMSERIRAMINKKYSDNEIVEFIRLVINSGIKCVDFYMIYGLPTETKEDVKAFKNLLIKIDEICPKGFVIAFHWNAFTPSAQTPMQWAASSYGYDSKYLISEIFDDKFQKNARFMHKPKLTSDDTILKRMVAIRSGSSEKNLVYTLAKNPKYFKNHKLVIKEFEKTSSIPLLGKVDINSEFPWDDCVEYPKDLLLKLFRRI